MARPNAPPLAAGTTAADGAGLASAKPTNETNSSAADLKHGENDLRVLALVGAGEIDQGEQDQ